MPQRQPKQFYCTVDGCTRFFTRDANLQAHIGGPSILTASLADVATAVYDLFAKMIVGNILITSVIMNDASCALPTIVDDLFPPGISSIGIVCAMRHAPGPLNYRPTYSRPLLEDPREEQCISPSPVSERQRYAVRASLSALTTRKPSLPTAPADGCSQYDLPTQRDRADVSDDTGDFRFLLDPSLVSRTQASPTVFSPAQHNCGRSQLAAQALINPVESLEANEQQEALVNDSYHDTDQRKPQSAAVDQIMRIVKQQMRPRYLRGMRVRITPAALRAVIINKSWVRHPLGDPLGIGNFGRSLVMTLNYVIESAKEEMEYENKQYIWVREEYTIFCRTYSHEGVHPHARHQPHTPALADCAPPHRDGRLP